MDSIDANNWSCPENHWDASRCDCDHPEEVSGEPIVTTPPTFDNIINAQSAANSLRCPIHVFSGPRDDPRRVLVVPDYTQSGSLEVVRPLMMVYVSDDGKVQLLYPVFHQQSWVDHETVHYPASIQDTMHGNYRNAWNHTPYPFEFGSTNTGFPGSCSRRWYLTKDDDESFVINWYSHQYNSSVQSTEVSMARVSAYPNIRGTGSSTLKYSGTKTSEELRKALMEEAGVIDPYQKGSPFLKCQQPFHSHSDMTNVTSFNMDDRKQLVRSHLGDNLHQKICQTLDTPNDTYDPSRYDKRSADLRHLLDCSKLDCPELCGDTFDKAYSNGEVGKTPGVHSTPASVSDLELAVFDLGYFKKKMEVTEGVDWWEENVNESLNAWYETMDGRICVMPPIMFHPSNMVGFLSIMKLDCQYTYMMICPATATAFGRYHGDRMEFNGNCSLRDGRVHYKLFFRVEDASAHAKLMPASEVVNCEKIGRLCLVPMPVWLGLRFDYNGHYLSLYSTITK